MDTVVLYPSCGVGHLAPMTELAKLLASHGLSVSIIVLPPFSPFSTASSVNNFISSVSSHPSISFHHLPPIPVPVSSSTAHKPSLIPLIPFLRKANPFLRDLLHSISQTSKIRAIVLDFVCTEALGVAAELNLPAYFFFTSGSIIVATVLYFPTLYDEIKEDLKDLGDTPIHLPGMPPIPASDFPDSMQTRDDLYQYVSHFACLPESKGVIVNSFEYLESRTLKTISQGLCLRGRVTPPVYCVGPLITTGIEGGRGERHECLAWLDKQPKGSLVFLCFGSMGRFPLEQVKEMAIGLERSEQRFLWVVRSPPDLENRFGISSSEPDLDGLLPTGFVERTEGRGMVVKGWAPQVEVLNHEATGGFVTHCGWNSMLEAVCAGVGMIAWPLYAEQKMNKVVLVEEMKLAVEMKDYDKGMVVAEELEKRVRWLMEAVGGRELRERAKEMKDQAAAAVSDGGSSHSAVGKLIKEWKGHSVGQ